MTSPAVYLDTCALINIAKDASLAHRFSAALASRGGTLILSWMHIFELARPDNRCVLEIEQLMDSLGGSFAFIDLIPTTVIEQEDRILSGGADQAPHLDLELSKQFVLTRLHSFGGFFANHDPRIGDLRKDFLKRQTERIAALRAWYNSDRRVRAYFDALPKGPRIPKATRYLFNELFHVFVRTSLAIENSNHRRDLFHAVVPVSYCDLVVLDKAWAKLAREVIGRIRNAGQTVEMAQVFPVMEIDPFLAALEGWPVVSRDR